MIVIADSSIVFSSLYTPHGVIASILKNKGRIQFIAPDFLFQEAFNHLPEIVKYTGKTKRQVIKELNKLTADIVFCPVDEIPKKHIYKAIELVKDIDIDDTFFVALHFYKGHQIWTGDTRLINGLEKKGYNICITTETLKESLYK